LALLLPNLHNILLSWMHTLFLRRKFVRCWRNTWQQDNLCPLIAFSLNLTKVIIFKWTPQLFEKTPMTTFHVFYAWTKSFIKSQFNWSYHVSLDITADKLPKYYELQRKVMGQWCVYLVMIHNIPQELVVNTNKIGMHIVPISGTKTWETKGFQHVNVHGMENKHQVTMVVFSTTNGNVYHSKWFFKWPHHTTYHHWMLVELHVLIMAGISPSTIITNLPWKLARSLWTLFYHPIRLHKLNSYTL